MTFTTRTPSAIATMPSQRRNPRNERRMTRRACALLAVLVCAVLPTLSGCATSSPPPRLYSLSTLDSVPVDATTNAMAGATAKTAMGAATDAAMSPAADAAAGTLVLGIGPVALPDYLNREQMVIRDGRNEIHLLEGHLWAGDLEDEFCAVLGENMSRLLDGARVVRYPWHSAMPVDFQLAVRVTRFDGAPDGLSVLAARWTLRDDKGAVLTMGTTHMEQPVDGPRPADLAASLSRTLGRLAKDMASEIRAAR